MYEMKKEYLTGIRMIDEEHKKLFEIADRLYELAQNNFMPDKYDSIKQILTELRDYTILHFEHEEKYMESIQYKKMFTQKIQHEEFRKEIEEWDLDSIDEKQDETIKEILTMVTDWLVEHILENDKFIGEE